jgi:hypothetical protein
MGARRDDIIMASILTYEKEIFHYNDYLNSELYLLRKVDHLLRSKSTYDLESRRSVFAI